MAENEHMCEPTYVTLRNGNLNQAGRYPVVQVPLDLLLSAHTPTGANKLHRPVGRMV